MKLKVKLDEWAIMPTRAHEADAGLDLYAPIDFELPACVAYEDTNRFGLFRVGLEVGSETVDTLTHIAIPRGYVGMIKSKSGLNVRNGIITEGVIDSGYTGSIRVKMYNLSMKTKSFKRGDKIAQLVILPCALPKLELVDELAPTERGSNGFGSTGR